MLTRVRHHQDRPAYLLASAASLSRWGLERAACVGLCLILLSPFLAGCGPNHDAPGSRLHQVRTTCLSPPQHFLAASSSIATSSSICTSNIKARQCNSSSTFCLLRAAPSAQRTGPIPASHPYIAPLPQRTKQERPASSPTRKPPDQAGHSSLELSKDCSTGTLVDLQFSRHATRASLDRRRHGFD